MRISDWSSDVCSSDLFSQAKVELLAPRALPLFALPKAWTPGTDGPVEGEAIAIEFKSKADIEKHKGKLRGKNVLLDPEREYKPGNKPDFQSHDEATLEWKREVEGKREIERRDLGGRGTIKKKQK